MNESINLRLEPIRQLAAESQLEIDDSLLHTNEQGARELYDQVPVIPTIGCEVEVKWSTLFPDLAHHYFGEQDDLGGFERKYADLNDELREQLNGVTNLLDAELKPKFEATRAAGIPAGSDAYWEFANAPCYSWTTLATEVGVLMRSGLIPTGYNHSLHVTLGQVEPTGGGMAMVLSGLELMYVQPERILTATRENNLGTATAWARRGEDGIRGRSVATLALGHTVATELRTMTVSDEEEAGNIFHDSQILAGILTAFRKRKGATKDEIHELASLWPVYRNTVKEVWREYDLPAASWGAPRKQPEYWKRWADVLRNRDTVGSVEHAAIHDIRQITDTADNLVKSLTSS